MKRFVGDMWADVTTPKFAGGAKRGTRGPAVAADGNLGARIRGNRFGILVQCSKKGDVDLYRVYFGKVKTDDENREVKWNLNEDESHLILEYRDLQEPGRSE